MDGPESRFEKVAGQVLEKAWISVALSVIFLIAGYIFAGLIDPFHARYRENDPFHFGDAGPDNASDFIAMWVYGLICFLVFLGLLKIWRTFLYWRDTKSPKAVRAELSRVQSELETVETKLESLTAKVDPPDPPNPDAAKFMSDAERERVRNAQALERARQKQIQTTLEEHRSRQAARDEERRLSAREEVRYSVHDLYAQSQHLMSLTMISALDMFDSSREEDLEPAERQAEELSRAQEGFNQAVNEWMSKAKDAGFSQVEIDSMLAAAADGRGPVSGEGS